MESTPEGSKPKPEVEDLFVEVPLHWESADRAQTVYANQLLISHAGPEFYLVFGEVTVLNPLKPTESLPVTPKVKVVISREMMGAFVDAINKNFNAFKSKVGIEDKKP